MMDSKITPLNGEIVLASKLDHVELFFFLKLVKLVFENESYELFFKKVLRLPKWRESNLLCRQKDLL